MARRKEGIFISQRKYTLELLKETGKLRCKPVGNPLERSGRARLKMLSRPWTWGDTTHGW